MHLQVPSSSSEQFCTSVSHRKWQNCKLCNDKLNNRSTRSNDFGARLTSLRGIAFDMSRTPRASQWFSGYPGLYHEAPLLIDGSQTVPHTNPSAVEVRLSSFGQLAIAEHTAVDPRDKHSKRVP